MKGSFDVLHHPLASSIRGQKEKFAECPFLPYANKIIHKNIIVAP